MASTRVSDKSKTLHSLESTQEEDLLQLSKKKVKNREGISEGAEEEELMVDGEPLSSSYKEVLMNVFGDDTSQGSQDEIVDEDLPENRWIREEEGDKPYVPGPEIPLTDEEWETWSKPWRHTLIVKVLGKRVNFQVMENKLQRSWVKVGKIKIIDAADDYYLVCFTAKEDYMHALFEGPWKVADHYLVVQHWRPFFSLTAEMSQKIAVWIHISKLPIELCNERFLRRIGSSLGTMLKVDKLTSLHSRGKFTRICVELDLGKQLASHIVIRGTKVNIEYEGLLPYVSVVDVMVIKWIVARR